MILPADIDIRSAIGPRALSYSEANTLAKCEMLHELTYGRPERERSAPSWRMELGTEIHAMWGAFWLTGVVPPTENETAAWVMARYAKVYGAQRNHGLIRMLSNELPFSSPLAFGFIDGLLEVTGLGPEKEGLWGAELKSTGSIDDILHLEHSLQLPTYHLALLDAGYDVRGVLLDVVETDGKDALESQDSAYKRHRAAGKSVAEAKELKKTDRLSVELPLDESFTRTWVTFTDEQLAEAKASLEAVDDVRSQLRNGRQPLRAINPMNCRGCSVIAECYGIQVSILDESPDSAE